jgi:hypothetical protein
MLELSAFGHWVIFSLGFLIGKFMISRGCNVILSLYFLIGNFIDKMLFSKTKWSMEISIKYLMKIFGVGSPT